MSVGGFSKRLKAAFYGACVQIHVTFEYIFGQGAELVLCFGFWYSAPLCGNQVDNLSSVNAVWVLIHCSTS